MNIVCCPEKSHKTIKLNSMKWTYIIHIYDLYNWGMVEFISN